MIEMSLERFGEQFSAFVNKEQSVAIVPGIRIMTESRASSYQRFYRQLQEANQRGDSNPQLTIKEQYGPVFDAVWGGHRFRRHRALLVLGRFRIPLPDENSPAYT